MDPYFQKIKKYIDQFLDVERAASLRWRADVNRRTVLMLLLAAVLGVTVYMTLLRAPSSFPVDELVTVPEGSSVKAIGYELKEQGVVRSPIVFRVLMVVFGHERGARAGDYLFKEPANVWTVARAIASGNFGLEPLRIRIPEGATVRQMATIYTPQLQRFNAERFLKNALPHEGYFFPDTYFFLPNANDEMVLQAMRQNFDDHLATLNPPIASSTRSSEDIIKMASILEREAFKSRDRKMIAGVLWNRIDRGMLLQVDAAFLYTLGKGTFELTRADLAEDSPYNTYKYKGFPPTPIGSPSLDSIQAAMNPIKNNYLFYLADNNGVTHYSKTYEEHLEKKDLYLGT
jgi:UPF0755 protein